MAKIFEISKKTKDFIAKRDAILNGFARWESNDLQGHLNNLLDHGEVEVGYRTSCKVTDPTVKIWQEWVKVIKKLKADGLEIKEEVIKHGNNWATLSGGFWHSTVFTLKEAKA